MRNHANNIRRSNLTRTFISVVGFLALIEFDSDGSTSNPDVHKQTINVVINFR
jgi:hypothetical protein